MSDLKERWIEALRSGKYSQGQGRLKRVDELDNNSCHFCCMGVLCDIQDANAWKSVPNFPNKTSIQWASKVYGNDEFFAPYDLIVEAFPELEEDFDAQDNLINQIAALNDKGGYTFEQLADLIEKGPEAIKIAEKKVSEKLHEKV